MKILEELNLLDTTTYRINPEINHLLGSDKKDKEYNYRVDFMRSGSLCLTYEYVLGRSYKRMVDPEIAEFYQDCLMGLAMESYDWQYFSEIGPDWIQSIIETAKYTGYKIFAEDDKIKTRTYRVNHEFYMHNIHEKIGLSAKALANTTYIDIVEHSYKFAVYIYNISDEKNNLLTIPKHLCHKSLSFQDAYMIILDNLRYTDCIANFISR